MPLLYMIDINTKRSKHLETKLVLSWDSSLSFNEPPTICLTWPECKSMQGLNAVRECGMAIG
jgi:hypothetical protein